MYTEHPRVPYLLDVKFAAPVPINSFCCEFGTYSYVSSLEIKNYSPAHFMK